MTERSIELTWLGQAGFVVGLGTMRIVIDPFLGEHGARLYPPPSLDELPDGRVDWILVTHDHLDHLDAASLTMLVDRHPDVRVVVPLPLADRLVGIVPEAQVTTVQPGDGLPLDAEVTLEVTPAYHGLEVSDGYTDGSGSDGQVRFVGYILRTPTASLYHAGDTIVTAALLEALDGQALDVALLPINGRDFFREQAGIVGNMSFREAVALALRLGVRVLVPMHWDLFDGNTERPGAVLDELAGLGERMHVLVLARLVPFRFS